MKVVLGVEYDGRGFCGWQRQTAQCSVQAVLEEAVSRVANESVSVICAGRTDAGVHASQQVVHFESRADRAMYSWRLGCNSQLPKSIRIVWAQAVDQSFHARYSAIARYYRYVILNRPVHSAHDHGLVTWCYKPLNARRMLQGSRILIGKHDFTSFRARACNSTSPCRQLYHIGVTKHDERIMIDVVGNAFLHHMVRNIVGVLIEIGVGNKPPEWTEQVLMSRNRKAGAATASSEGLYLAGVYYPKHFKISCHPMFDLLPEGVQRIEATDL